MVWSGCHIPAVLETSEPGRLAKAAAAETEWLSSSRQSLNNFGFLIQSSVYLSLKASLKPCREKNARDAPTPENACLMCGNVSWKKARATRAFILGKRK